MTKTKLMRPIRSSSTILRATSIIYGIGIMYVDTALYMLIQSLEDSLSDQTIPVTQKRRKLAPWCAYATSERFQQLDPRTPIHAACRCYPVTAPVGVDDDVASPSESSPSPPASPAGCQWPEPPPPPPTHCDYARQWGCAAHCREDCQAAAFQRRFNSLRRVGSCHSAITFTSNTHNYPKEYGSQHRFPAEDEEFWQPMCDRGVYSLHRSFPSLRCVEVPSVKQHYYPEGGWGWIVCGAAFLAHLLSSGMQLAFGLLYLYSLKHLGDHAVVDIAWLGALSVSVTLLTAPCAVSLCRRKWTRLTAVLGGVVLALACLFTSFAIHLHQLLLSYGVLLGVACGLVRETSSLTLGHYFKKRREFIEMVVQAGAGIGIALFSVLYREAVGQWGWRLGLQAITVLLCLSVFLGTLYRSASMYHPQRRTIQHLKSQREKVKQKKSQENQQPNPPFFDLSALRLRSVQVLMLAAAVGALGIYTPVFYLALQGYEEGLDDSSLVLLQTFLGFATALGCVGFGLVVVRASEQCLVSRQYLCQAAMVGVGLSLLALSTVQGYHGYVLFVWLYGVCLGGFFYSLKVFTMESVRSRYFARAWGFVQGAEALPVLLGVPITGYINQSHPKAGYYFSLLATLLGAALLFLVGGPGATDWEDVPQSLPPPTPLAICGRPRLHKSISFATPLDIPEEYWRPVRSCRSVPEGLGRQQPLTVVEQITTSV